MSCRARSEKARIFATRSSLPVSSVMARENPGPVNAMQVWPDLSPYRLPVGPVAPVSPSPQFALNRSRTVLARSNAYGSVEARSIGGGNGLGMSRNPDRAYAV